MFILRIFSLLFIFSSATVASQEPKLVLPSGHENSVLSATFSPDGKRIVTTSADHTAKVWDGSTGILLTELKHSSDVHTAVFSPDGKKIVTASADKTVNIWDTKTGILLAELKGHESLVRSAVFSRDGKRIISAGGEAIVWDAYTGDRIADTRKNNETNEFIRYAEFSSDNKKILTVGYDTKIWDASLSTILLKIKRDEKISFKIGRINVAHFSPDGKKVVTASEDSTAKIYDATTGILIARLKGTEAISSAQFSNDNNKVVTASDSVKIWNASTGRLLNIFEFDFFASTAEFSEDDKKIVIGGDISAVCNVITGKVESILKGHTKGVYSAKFSPDSRKVVTASDDCTAKLWDAATGAILAELRSHISTIYFAKYFPEDEHILTSVGNTSIRKLNVKNGNIDADMKGYSAEFSPDRKKILTRCRDYTMKIWDASNGVFLLELKGHTGPINSATFSPDGKKIISASFDQTAKIWDAENGDILTEVKHDFEIKYAEFSPDGQKIVTTSYQTAKIWETSTGIQLVNIPHQANGLLAKFSPNGRKIITMAYENSAKVWDVFSGDLLLELKGHTDWITHTEFSPDGRKIFTASRDNTLKTWEESTGMVISQINNDDDIHDFHFLAERKQILTTSIRYGEGIRVKLWDAASGQFLADIAGATKDVKFISFSPDEKKIATTYTDNTVMIRDFKTSRIICSYFTSGEKGYLMRIPTGEFLSTIEVAKLLHYVTKDLKVITFEQMDIKYNRPDKVLEALGSKDTLLIRSYRKAWEKRIKKLKIDTTQFRDGFSVPDADFLDRDNMEYEQRKDNLQLHIKGTDTTYKLDRFNIWANEVPVYGQKGISLKNRNSNNFDTTITIKLSEGENRIEMSITNVNGTESYRMPLSINYTPEIKQKEMTRFIGIGIDQFTDSKYNLQYSVKDIRDLADSLKKKYKDNVIIDTLFNANVTSSNVKALKQKLQETTENDKVIIAYSGHGMLSKDFDYYLSTYAVNFDKPEQNGLPYEELENLLDSIPARKKLMLIDACHSGEVDKDDLITLNGSSDSLIRGLRPVAYKKEGRLGLKNSFELMQSLFVNVGKSTGATIISAAAGTQFALERNDLRNGVFTYSILEAMNKYPTLKLSELKKIVGERVEQLTKGLQKPTSRNETIAVDWSVW